MCQISKLHFDHLMCDVYVLTDRSLVSHISILTSHECSMLILSLSFPVSDSPLTAPNSQLSLSAPAFPWAGAGGGSCGAGGDHCELECLNNCLMCVTSQQCHPFTRHTGSAVIQQSKIGLSLLSRSQDPIRSGHPSDNLKLVTASGVTPFTLHMESVVFQQSEIGLSRSRLHFISLEF